MTFSFVDEMQLLFSRWKVTSYKGLAGSIIAVISLAVLNEFLGTYHSYLDLPAMKRNPARFIPRNKRLQDHIMKTCSYVLSVTTGYMLMLVVDKYDVWLFMSIIFGAGFGYFLSNPLYTWYRSVEVRSQNAEK